MKIKKEVNPDLDYRLLDLTEFIKNIELPLINTKYGSFYDYGVVNFNREPEALAIFTQYLESRIPILTICSNELKELFLVSYIQYMQFYYPQSVINRKSLNSVDILVSFLNHLFIPKNPIPSGLTKDPLANNIILNNPKTILDNIFEHDMLFIKWAEEEAFIIPNNQATEIESFLVNPKKYRQTRKNLMNSKKTA